MDKYIDDLKAINNDELFEGLLCYGLFNSKLPNFLTSKPFYEYCIKNDIPDDKKWCDWIRFDNNRNNGLPRTLGIPDPFSYYHLCKNLKNNWNNLLDYFSEKTEDQNFKISRIHIKKIIGKKNIFVMNYDTFKFDGPSVPYNSINSKIIVKADISKFFESIYTHSLAWAVFGKPAAKTLPRSSFPNDVDDYQACTKYGETHGILIGPVSSNLISEIIMCNIDQKLTSKGFIFTRCIDDYKCYVEDNEKAEQFLNTLRLELAKFDLSLNEKKIEIIPIHLYKDIDLKIKVHQLDYLLTYKNGLDILTYPQIVSYLEAISKLYIELDFNASVYVFAFKILSKYNLSINASRFLIDKALNLSINIPYLLTYLEDWVFDLYGITDNMKDYCKSLYSSGIKESNYEKCIYALYFGIVHSIDFFKENKDCLFENAQKKNDCVFRLLSWLYCKSFYGTEFETKFYDLALEINTPLDDYDFQRNWLFAYEILNEKDLGKRWKAIKKKKVTFIDKTKLGSKTHWRTIFYK